MTSGLSLQMLAAYELGQRQCTVVRPVELCAAMDERPDDLLTRVQRRVALDQTDRVRINLSKVAATTHPDLLPLRNSTQDRLMTETPGSPSTQAIQVDLATLDALATPCGVPPAGRGTLDFDYEQMRRRQQHHDGDRGPRCATFPDTLVDGRARQSRNFRVVAQRRRPKGVLTAVRVMRVAGLGVLGLVLAACSGQAEVAGVARPVPTTTSAMPAAKVAVITEGGDQMSPRTPIVIKASDGTLQTVTVTNPQSGNTVNGDFSPDKTTWTSNDHLRYGATYLVVATAMNKEGRTVEQTGQVHTLAPAGVAVPTLFQPQSSGSFGVGVVIGVKFDRDITDKAAMEKSFKVISTPAQDGSWYWVSKREVHFRPKDYWKAGTTVKLETTTFGMPVGGGAYGGPDVSATYRVHDSWIAKADGNTHQMQAFHNGELVKTAPISMGKTVDTPPRGPTPTFNGTHTVLSKVDHIIMDSCTYGVCEGQPGYYKAPENWDVQISNDGEYLHENLATVSVQGSQNVSNGCLNMNTDNAKWFFDNFNIGDVVEVTNSGGPPLPIDNGHGDWALSWSAWQAGSALHG